MTEKREIFRKNGRYEQCYITYWPEGQKPDYIIAIDDRGHEMVCHQAMGAWCEISMVDLITRLRVLDRLMKKAEAE